MIPRRVGAPRLASLLLIAGCTSEGATVPDAPGPALALRCGEASLPGPLREITSAVAIDQVDLGPCGHLAYGDATGAHVLDPAFERELAATPDGSAALDFSPDGATLLIRTATAIRVEDLLAGVATVVDTVAPSLWPNGGFLAWDSSWTVEVPGASSPRSVAFVCGADGLSLVINGQLRPAVGGAGTCDAVTWSEHGGVVILRDRDGHLHAADLAHGVDRRLPVEPTLAAPQRIPADRLHLSADGRVLIHLPAWDVACEDTYCPESDGIATVVDLATAAPVGTAAARMEPRDRGIELVEDPDLGGGLAVGGEGVMTLVDRGPRPRLDERPGFEPLAAIPGHDDLLARRGDALVIAPYGAGPPIELSPDFDGEPIAVSKDGTVIAFPRFSLRCIAYPDRPGLCHKQLWEVIVWSRDAGVIATYAATQPLVVRWVGSDGSVLVAGPLIHGEVPATAPPDFDGDPGLHLLAPDGRALRRWEAEVEQIAEIDGGLVLALRDAERSVSLSRVDVATGAERSIDRTPSLLPAGVLGYPELHFWTDAHAQRLAYRMDWEEGANQVARSSLHAGAMPDP
jgi:hypothetical protein